jgi:hypothetical protein
MMVGQVPELSKLFAKELAQVISHKISGQNSDVI